MTKEEIAEAREICDAAAPAPWIHDTDNSMWTGNLVWKSNGPGYGAWMEAGPDRSSDPQDIANAKFTAAARTALPEALDEIEFLREQLRIAQLPQGDSGE